MQLKVLQATLDFRLFGEDKCVRPKPGQTVEVCDIGLMVRRVNKPMEVIPWTKVRNIVCQDYPPPQPPPEPKRRGRPPKQKPNE